MSNAKIAIVLYTTYHHVYKIAQAIKVGLDKVPGVESTIVQITETLPQEVLTAIHAPAKPDLPIVTANDLVEYDGFLFGIPTRYGNQPSQWRSFWDAAGGLWAKGAFQGKFAGTFFSTASQHGGQETTALTFLTTLSHFGINYVPLGFPHPALTDNTEVIGGSPYGAGTIANGDGSRQPSEKELSIANTQGELFGKILAQFQRGKQ
ncbi:NAD(P)H:quinone oxidoreductase, type IV [Piptocephalis cylindrospora]|uniref:NAD(P)H:quinone oxidoreductase, type IV n=1 Tax=Piptocephalis cylindrospora TaxID=1907219 RepID=A0A4P9Y1R8_9FUNG|nr:NAD(P)H:quinone oxidoreductase, type IV [Piptocephalis cylindrospora]|eukprot:RKP12778.1 NAD(P)H:quinone oxidoreductase, type IV [Piptocephalis cylindrospora]